MLGEARILELLDPFGLRLSSSQVAQIETYLELLMRWNKKINLTAIRSPEECVTRHFGESLSLARWVELKGELLDIGSGAGFPGLALKIASPDLSVSLLEPVAKKRAFLKEVSRVTRMENVEVRRERIEDYIGGGGVREFDLATCRAVSGPGTLVQHATNCLKEGGHLCIWITRQQAAGIGKADPRLEWKPPIALPFSAMREIWIGRNRKGTV